MEQSSIQDVEDKWDEIVDKLDSFDSGYYRFKEVNFITYKLVKVDFNKLSERLQNYFIEDLDAESLKDLPDFYMIKSMDESASASDVDFIVMEYWAQEADGGDLEHGLRRIGIKTNDLKKDVENNCAYIFESRDGRQDKTVFDDEDVKKVIQNVVKEKGIGDSVLLITDWGSPKGFINVVGAVDDSTLPNVTYEPFSYIPC